MKTKQYKPREVEKILWYNGYKELRSGKGSHRIYSNGEHVISLPTIRINPYLFKRIVKENDLVIM